MNVFVTGTDTDVGKTAISAWICLHTNADYWKPIQTGDDSDKSVVAQISPHTKILPEAYKLAAPLSAYDSAKLENTKIDVNAFDRNLENTVVEGAGGALVPIADDFFTADLAKVCRAKALIVARSKLGFVNHILMTAEVLRARKIDILGIVINGQTEDYLKETVEKFSRLKILAVIPFSDDLATTLRSQKLPAELLF
ncbi:MAG: dethiobiotin synthase [Holosporaceae bacterium]|jgi:dethiobiotin synthetase/malonyl-CoA O-methyltransferase|nr:dethiobiotin synthase [Holosporaceae bacterium]